MAKVLATPGVYVEEKSAFSSSIVAVPTAESSFLSEFSIVVYKIAEVVAAKFFRAS